MDENDKVQELWDIVGWRGVIAVAAVIGLLIFARGRRRKKPTLLETVADGLAQQQKMLQSISDRLSPRSSIVDMIHDRIAPQPTVGERISDVAAPIKSAMDNARGGLSQAPTDAWKTIKQTVTQG